MERQDWVLLALASADGGWVQPVQLQKTLFLLKEDLPQDVGPAYFSFSPYHYGAFDKAIYEDAEALERRGLIEISPSAGHPRRAYRVTEAGSREAASVVTSPRARQHLRELMTWARGLSFAQLVSAVYNKHPWTRSRSIFTG